MPRLLSWSDHGNDGNRQPPGNQETLLRSQRRRRFTFFMAQLGDIR
jgi:hypothetical protein